MCAARPEPSPAQSRETRSSLQTGLAWFVTFYGIALVAYLALNAIASRFLGKGSYGYFAIVMTATTIVGQFALLGVHRAGLRETARVTDGGDADLATLRFGVRAICLVSLPIGGFVSGIVTWLLTDDRSAQQRLVLAVEVAIITILSGHQKLWANYLRGFGMVRFASLMEGRYGGALVAICQSILVAIVWAVWPRTALTGTLAAVAAGYLLPILVAYYYAARFWRHASGTRRLIRDLTQVVRRDWRFASGQLAAYMNASLELWIAGIALSGVDTSLFGSSQRLSLLLVTPITSLQVVFSPAISRLAGASDRARLENLVRTGATVAAVPMMALCIPLLVAPGHVLRIVYGDGFEHGSLALLLITLGSVVNVLTGLCGATLSMTHQEGAIATIQWIGLGCRLAMGLGAAYTFGIDGLAASCGIMTSAVYGAMWLAAKRRLRVNTFVTLRPELSLLRRTIS